MQQLAALLNLCYEFEIQNYFIPINVFLVPTARRIIGLRIIRSRGSIEMSFQIIPFRYSTRVKMTAEARAPFRQARIFFLYPSTIAGASIATYAGLYVVGDINFFNISLPKIGKPSLKFEKIDEIWQHCHLVTFGNIWQHLATFGNIWQHFDKFVSAICRIHQNYSILGRKRQTFCDD